MHLINIDTLELEEHIDRIPRYAILSHTWGNEEVSYQEMMVGFPKNSRPQTTQQKAGYVKIEKTCELARHHDPTISHVWIDTCCIDKSSSADLTENINSMFEYYTRAEICLVYLVDLPPHVPFAQGIEHCKWITRGWTLQEMIASREIEFYGAPSPSIKADGDWVFRGTKSQFCEALARCTGVPKLVLDGKRDLESCSVAQRMSWASNRKTTRPEDIAYCLLGIFGVNMPLIYGEREVGAFRRLQEAIIRKNNDMTIFAWTPINTSTGTNNTSSGSYCSIFAPSPANFQTSNNIEPWEKWSHDPEYTLTNKGLRMEETLYYVPQPGHSNTSLKREYVLALGVDYSYPLTAAPSVKGTMRGPSSSTSYSKTTCVGIHLRKIGPDLFVREHRELTPLTPKTRGKLAQTPEAPFYVLADGEFTTQSSDHHGGAVYGTMSVRRGGTGAIIAQFRNKGIRFLGQVSQINIIPQGLWDSVDRCFFHTRLTLVRGLKTNLLLEATTTTPDGTTTRGSATGGGGGISRIVKLGVLLGWSTSRSTGGEYVIRLFDTAEYETQTREIFSFRHHRETKEGLRWREVEEKYPEIMELGNEMRINVKSRGGDAGGSVFVITASAVPEDVEGFYPDAAGQTVEMCKLVLTVREETPHGLVVREIDGMDLLFKGQK